MVLKVEVEFGEALPPQSPHAVTYHVPGWDVADKFHRKDLGDIIPRLKAMYPRFMPFGSTRAVSELERSLCLHA
jgi:cystathionine gamma-synthase